MINRRHLFPCLSKTQRAASHWTLKMWCSAIARRYSMRLASSSLRDGVTSSAPGLSGRLTSRMKGKRLPPASSQRGELSGLMEPLSSLIMLFLRWHFNIQALMCLVWLSGPRALMGRRFIEDGWMNKRTNERSCVLKKLLYGLNPTASGETDRALHHSDDITTIPAWVMLTGEMKTDTEKQMET